MQQRKASIKETGEELSSAEWERFDAAVADLKAERKLSQPRDAHDEPPRAAEPGDRPVARIAR